MSNKQKWIPAPLPPPVSPPHQPSPTVLVDGPHRKLLRSGLILPTWFRYLVSGCCELTNSPILRPQTFPLPSSCSHSNCGRCEFMCIRSEKETHLHRGPPLCQAPCQESPDVFPQQLCEREVITFTPNVEIGAQRG